MNDAPDFPVASVRGLVKTFRDFWGRPRVRAVDGIDFEIRRGEVLALLGPNGSGKSTTVKLLLGLLYPTRGSISVFGKSPRAVETKREIGYLPEESDFYPFLTARETLDFFGSLFALSRAERKSRIDQLLDMVGLSHARDRRVGEFSKGMARRIGLAQAMINDPDLLILDEPTSGLDPIGCREVKDLILTLKKRGKTVLITGHLLADVEDVCDRVVILYGGKVRAAGGIGELLTVGERTRITLPGMPPEALEKLTGFLLRNFPDAKPEIDHPRRSLEEFFLDVVRQAKEEKLATSGADAGGQIAAYLSGADEKSDVLRRLLDENAAPIPRDAGTPAETAVREEKLADLVQEASTPVPAEETSVPDDREALERAGRKLDRMFGGK